MSEQVVISMEGESYSFVSSAITFILCLTAILTAYHYWFKNLRHVKLTDNIPSPRTLPILGHIHMGIGKSPTDVYDLVYDLYHKLNSDIVKLYFGPKLYIGICSAEDAELILGSSVHLEKPQEYRLFEPWLGDGLLISKGEKWRSHRKMIAPTFHTSILKSFMPVFNKNANNLVEQFKKEKKVFDVHNQMSAVTVDTLLETSMGVVKTDEDNTGFDYAMAVMDCFIVDEDLNGAIGSESSPWGFVVIKRKKEDYMARKKSGETSLYMRAVKTGDYEDNQGSQDIMTNYIKDDLDENDDNDVGEKKRLAFLDFMIEASQTGNNITDEEIKEEVDTIMFEVSAWELLQFPIFFSDGLLIIQIFFIHEFSVTGDYIIPAGTSVGICQVLIHRNKKYYKDPLKFDPDNFLPERCQERPYYAYVPFSAGPRSCVGRKYAMLKLKVLLAGVLRKFQIHCSETEEDFKLQADIILKKTGGFNISVTERKH
nr:cytochrome P450 4g15-like [Leptinotarsa decemlineata]